MQRRPEGVTMIAVWYFILAGGCVLGLIAMFLAILGVWSGGDLHGMIFGTLGMSIGVVAILGALAAFGLTGWGLVTLKDWAPPAAKVLAILQLVVIPFGTIAGIMTLVYLSRNEEAKLAFRGAAAH